MEVVISAGEVFGTIPRSHDRSLSVTGAVPGAHPPLLPAATMASGVTRPPATVSLAPIMALRI